MTNIKTELTRFALLWLIIPSVVFAKDTGKILIVSDSYQKCGLAVALYDQEDNLLAMNNYLRTRDYRRVLFIYQPEKLNLPIAKEITVRTQFPAMQHPGCWFPYTINSYTFPWVPNTELCFMVNETNVLPCDPNLLYGAPGRFISKYPPRQSDWTPSQDEYFTPQR